MLQDYAECKFSPRGEVDVQGYLYHCCYTILEKVADRPDIFLEYRKEKRPRYDLLLGAHPLAVEVKWSSPRARENIPGAWQRDVDRLCQVRQQGQARKPYFVLFVAPKPRKPVVPRARDVLPALTRLRQYAEGRKVHVLSIDKFRWGSIRRPLRGPREKRRWIDQLAEAQDEHARCPVSSEHGYKA